MRQTDLDRLKNRPTADSFLPWNVLRVAIFALLFAAAPAAANYIYFDQYRGLIDPPAGTIWRAGLDGSNRELVLQTGTYRSDGLAVDQAAEKIYWAEQRWPERSSGIMRANIDGTGMHEIISSGSVENFFFGLFFDEVDQKLYFSQRRPLASDPGGLMRADPDGSNAELVRSAGWIHRYVVNHSDQKIYFSEFRSLNHLRRMDLDGRNMETLATGYEIRAVAVDPEGQRIYWSQAPTSTDRGDTIKRANLDGSGVETVLRVPSTEIQSIALDGAERKIYWTDALTSQALVYRANIDGSNIEVIARPVPGPSGAESHMVVLALTPSPLLIGDADNDGDVDNNDLAIVAANFGVTAAATRAHGDFDDNGQVNLQDVWLLQTHLGDTLAALSPAAAIPEPASWALALVSMALGTFIRFQLAQKKSSPHSARNVERIVKLGCRFAQQMKLL